MIKTIETDALLKQCKIKGRNPDPWKLCRKLERERNNLKQEVERLKTMSVCELGAHNDSVRDYMEHWECRALTAERERDEAQKACVKWVKIALREASINGSQICGKETTK